MKITAISPQVRDKNRVNISIDGKYRFSLDIYQLLELHIKVGAEYDEAQIANLEHESQFGKVYSRALEYCLARPRSSRELKDYLYRKKRQTIDKKGNIKPGITDLIAARVFDRLAEKKYVDDENFARFWIENRFVKKGVSQRRLKNELKVKGVDGSVIEKMLANSERSDDDEIRKIIIKKRSRYDSDEKLVAYLMRLGFNYEDIKDAIEDSN
jgi:regulatory protein